MSRYAGKNIVVVGAGKTGLALAGYFLERGARVTLSDRRERGFIQGIEKLNEQQVDYDLGGHATDKFVRADLIVVSPGVPLAMPAISAAVSAGVAVVGEIEVAYGELQAPIIGITGTNGKSTVTSLLGEIYAAWGKKAFVGGNLGTPLITAVDGAWDVAIVELSSFQLEAIRAFRAHTAILLNVSEDHLDRYPDMASYCAAKAHLFDNQGSQDVAIVNGDDPLAMETVHGQARRVMFHSSRVPDEGIGFDGTKIVWNYLGEEVCFNTGELLLPGLHNVENVMAALVPPLLEGCPAEVAWKAVCGFKGLPHRMNLVRELDGVRWYNDSKGTNVGSVLKSLAGLDAPVTLIAGGKDKGGDYGPMCKVLRDKQAHLVLIGEAAGRMAKELAGCCPIDQADDLKGAVLKAREVTPEGGAVLLSPGCSSFDMFKSYEERGEVFTAEVEALVSRNKG